MRQLSPLDREAIDQAVAQVWRARRSRLRAALARVARAWKPLAILALVALPIAAIAFIANYQPIARSDASRWPIDRRDCVQNIGSVTAPASRERFDFYKVDCPPGTTISWGHSIRNQGPLDIEFVALPPIEGAPRIDYRLSPGPGSMGIDVWDRMEPAADLRIPAGDERILSVRVDTGPCSRRGGHTTISGMQVRFKVLGFTRTDWIPYPWSSQIHCS